MHTSTASLLVMICLLAGAGCAATSNPSKNTPAERLALAAFPDRDAAQAAHVYLTPLWAGEGTSYDKNLRAHYLPVGLLIVGPNDHARRAVMRVGWGMFHSPGNWFELIDVRGNPVQWAPGYTERGIPGVTVSLRRPGRHIVESLPTGEVLFVEPYSVPLANALEPGKYRIRLKPDAAPQDWVVNDHWLEFEVKVEEQAEANPVEILPDGRVRLSDGRVVAPSQSRS